MSLTVLPDRHNDPYPEGATRMLLEHADGTASKVRTHNIISSDIEEVVAFIKAKGSTTHGFEFVYAVKDSQVVEFMKRGRFAKRDLAKMLEEGFREFFVSWAFAGNNFLLASGKIVRSESREINPKAITKEAFRMKAMFGY